MLKNRSQYATFITILLAGIVLSVSSLLVLEFESRVPDANIHSGGDAIWWGLVTITTVGYGDFYPVTLMGRITGIFVMFAGIGIIGALASILASMLVSPTTPAEPAEEPAPAVAPGSLPAVDPLAIGSVAEELAAIRAELAALRKTLAEDRGAPGTTPSSG